MSEPPSREQPASGDHKLILASRVDDAPVFNTAGERIGHIDDLSIDRVSGQVTYAIMSFGGFLGIGKRFHPMPWSSLEYDPDRGGYVVSLDERALRDAPHYDSDELEHFGGASNEARYALSAYYGGYGYYGPF